MPRLPTIDENPNGLHQRYSVTKVNGEPTDDDAVYFVLRLDKGGRDKCHTRVSRVAARAYAKCIAQDTDAGHLVDVGQELRSFVDEIDKDDESQACDEDKDTCSIDGIYRYQWTTRFGRHSTFIYVANGIIVPDERHSNSPVKPFVDKSLGEFTAARVGLSWKFKDDSLIQVTAA